MRYSLTSKLQVYDISLYWSWLKVNNLFIFLILHINVIDDIEKNCLYVNNPLIFVSNDAEKAKEKLYEVTNKLEEKRSNVETIINRLSTILVDI